MRSYGTVWGTAGAFAYGPANGDRVEIVYESVTTETRQHVEGTVHDAAESEFTRLEDDDGEIYTIYGFDVADRRLGEVCKSGRRIGYLNKALGLEE